jgi:hypothetical protein
MNRLKLLLIIGSITLAVRAAMALQRVYDLRDDE